MKEVALLGIGLNTLGVIMLFFFGMPFRVPSDGKINIILNQRDDGAAKLDTLYKRLGWLAFLLVVTGAGLQAYAVWLSP